MTLDLIKLDSPGAVSPLHVSALLESFLHAQDIRPNSKISYRKGLLRFLSWLASNGITRPDREVILSFKSYLHDRGLSANTINTYLAGVKCFFAYLEGKKLYPNIAGDIKGIKQANGHLKESLTLAQIKDLMGNIETSTLQGKRDYAMLNLMARTGLRTIEVSRVSVEDIKQEGGEALLYVQGKGRDSKDAFVVLTEKALNPILIYLEARRKTGQDCPLFASTSDRKAGDRLSTRSISKIVKERLRAIHIDSKKISAHSLRHTFATLSLRAGAPLIQVKDALRHSSIETTQKYLHNLERIEKAAERYIDF